jgi:hypothetical protein
MGRSLRLLLLGMLQALFLVQRSHDAVENPRLVSALPVSSANDNLDPIFAFKLLGTAHFGGLTSKCCTSSSALGEATMAGRYQGCHVLRDVGCREVEVFWHHNGWFWRPRQLHSDAVGPFTTSTEAYQSPKAERHSRARPQQIGLASNLGHWLLPRRGAPSSSETVGSAQGNCSQLVVGQISSST